MLLFENVVIELAVGKLLVQETQPLGSSPTGGELATVAGGINVVAECAPAIVEGTPQLIAASL